jgi:hypothetical protein
MTLITSPNIIPVLNKQELVLRAERLVKSDGLTYIEAILEICKELDIDPEDVSKLISGPLKDKIEAEGQRNNSLRRSNTASLDDILC